MAREKKPVHKVQMTEGKRNIIHQLLQEYDIETAEVLYIRSEILLSMYRTKIGDCSLLTLRPGFSET